MESVAAIQFLHTELSLADNSITGITYDFLKERSNR